MNKINQKVALNESNLVEDKNIKNKLNSNKYVTFIFNSNMFLKILF